MVIDFMSNDDLATLALTCKEIQVVTEERLFKRLALDKLISRALDSHVCFRTFQRLTHYRKTLVGRQECYCGGFPAVIKAAPREYSSAVDLLLENRFILTKKALSNLLTHN